MKVNFSKRIIIILVCLITIITTGFNLSCESETGDGVVVSILPLADFVRHVGGDKVKVTTMIGPGASPHEYIITMSQMKALSKAKAYFKVGSGIEFELTQLDKLISQNSKMPVFDCSAGISIIDKDPHIWTSPLNAKIMVENICRGLIEIDPENADTYIKNKNAYINELDNLDKYIKDRISGLSNKVYLIYHPSFAYLANDYGLTQFAIEVEGQEVTFQSLQQSINTAIQYKLAYIFGAPAHEKDLDNARIIAESISEWVVQVKPMNDLPENYIENMKSVIDSLYLEFSQ